MEKAAKRELNLFECFIAITFISQLIQIRCLSVLKLILAQQTVKTAHNFPRYRSKQVFYIPEAPNAAINSF
jgi:hypothetical protein